MLAMKDPEQDRSAEYNNSIGTPSSHFFIIKLVVLFIMYLFSVVKLKNILIRSEEHYNRRQPWVRMYLRKDEEKVYYGEEIPERRDV